MGEFGFFPQPASLEDSFLAVPTKARVLSKNSICLRVRQLATKVWCTEESAAGCYEGPWRVLKDALF